MFGRRSKRRLSDWLVETSQIAEGLAVFRRTWCESLAPFIDSMLVDEDFLRATGIQRPPGVESILQAAAEVPLRAYQLALGDDLIQSKQFVPNRGEMVEFRTLLTAIVGAEHTVGVLPRLTEFRTTGGSLFDFKVRSIEDLLRGTLGEGVEREMAVGGCRVPLGRLLDLSTSAVFCRAFGDAAGVDGIARLVEDISATSK